MKKIILALLLLLSGYGIYKAGKFLWGYGYYGGLKEAYILLGLIICSIIFIISCIFLLKNNKTKTIKK